MSLIVEVNEQGSLYLPAEMIGNAKPHTRFVLRRHGEILLLHPEEEQLPFLVAGLSLSVRATSREGKRTM